MSRIITSTVYTLNELSATAQEKARDWYRQHHADSNWYENVYEDFRAVCDIFGIDLRQRVFRLSNGRFMEEPCIWFSGFCSQGDGACFEGLWHWQPATPRKSGNMPLRTVSSTIEDTLRSGGILNLNSLAIALGEFAAPMGTGAALVILACGLVLWTQKDVHIGASASFLITCGLIAFFFPRQVGLADSTLFSSLLPRLQGIRDELHTGAVLFCAVFLLNEPYTCAHHRLGRILYGALVGAATMGFRYFGVYETGVCFALLAVNSVSALIDRTEERLYRLLHRLPSERKEAAE